MQEEGYVAALLYPEGAADVALGEIVAVIVENKEDVAAFADYSAADAAGGAAEPASAPAEQQSAPAAAPSSATTAAPSGAPAAASGDRIFVSPLAKKTAAEKGIPLDQITGTGPNNRIIKADVDQHKVAAPKAAPQAAATAAPSTQNAMTDLPQAVFEDIENSTIRKVIAERLTYSK